MYRDSGHCNITKDIPCYEPTQKSDSFLLKEKIFIHNFNFLVTILLDTLLQNHTIYLCKLPEA